MTVISLIPSKWDAPPKRNATNTRKRFMPRLVGPAFASPPLPPLNGPSAARSLFCLAPHGVFRAPPVARLVTLTLSLGLTFPKVPAAGRSIFCDTFREPSLSARLPAYSTRRVAWWCSDFPLTPGSLGFPHICPKRTLDKSKANSNSPCASDCLSPAATFTLRSFFDCARHAVEKSPAS